METFNDFKGIEFHTAQINIPEPTENIGISEIATGATGIVGNF